MVAVMDSGLRCARPGMTGGKTITTTAPVETARRALALRAAGSARPPRRPGSRTNGRRGSGSRAAGSPAPPRPSRRSRRAGRWRCRCAACPARHRIEHGDARRIAHDVGLERIGRQVRRPCRLASEHLDALHRDQRRERQQHRPPAGQRSSTTRQCCSIRIAARGRLDREPGRLDRGRRSARPACRRPRRRADRPSSRRA